MSGEEEATEDLTIDNIDDLRIRGIRPLVPSACLIDDVTGEPSVYETVSAARRGVGNAVPRGLNYGGAGGSGLGASIGQASTRAGGAGTILGAASVENSRFSSGYIFGCKPETYEENLRRQVFGVTKQHLGDIQKIAPSSVLFLFNYSTKMLHGVFVPNGPGGLNLEP